MRPEKGKGSPVPGTGEAVVRLRTIHPPVLGTLAPKLGRAPIKSKTVGQSLAIVQQWIHLRGYGVSRHNPLWQRQERENLGSIYPGFLIF